MTIHRPDYEGETLVNSDGRPQAINSPEAIIEGAESGAKFLRWTCLHFVTNGGVHIPRAAGPRRRHLAEGDELWCSRCEQYKKPGEFDKSNKYTRGYRYWCRECERKQRAAHYHRSKIQRALRKGGIAAR